MSEELEVTHCGFCLFYCCCFGGIGSILSLGLFLLALSSNTCFEGRMKYKIIHRHAHSSIAKEYNFNHS